MPLGVLLFVTAVVAAVRAHRAGNLRFLFAYAAKDEPAAALWTIAK